MLTCSCLSSLVLLAIRLGVPLVGSRGYPDWLTCESRQTSAPAALFPSDRVLPVVLTQGRSLPPVSLYVLLLRTPETTRRRSSRKVGLRTVPQACSSTLVQGQGRTRCLLDGQSLCRSVAPVYPPPLRSPLPFLYPRDPADCEHALTLSFSGRSRSFQDRHPGSLSRRAESGSGGRLSSLDGPGAVARVCRSRARACITSGSRRAGRVCRWPSAREGLISGLTPTSPSPLFARNLVSLEEEPSSRW